MPALMTGLVLCTVLSVQDGDTLRARCEEHAVPITVRLHAIDAPEQGQPDGQRARQALAAWALRRSVWLDCVDSDAYGRQVCRVYALGSTPAVSGASAQTDVGLALLHAGWAWWMRRYAEQQDPQDRAQYEAAEQRARTHRRGLWRAGDAVIAPWRWRREHPRQD